MVAAAAAGDRPHRGVERVAEGDEMPAGEMPHHPQGGGHWYRSIHASDPAKRWANDSALPSGVWKGSV